MRMIYILIDTEINTAGLQILDREKKIMIQMAIIVINTVVSILLNKKKKLKLATTVIITMIMKED